jgi:hypothetical protein
LAGAILRQRAAMAMFRKVNVGFEVQATGAVEGFKEFPP